MNKTTGLAKPLSTTEKDLKSSAEFCHRPRAQPSEDTTTSAFFTENAAGLGRVNKHACVRDAHARASGLKGNDDTPTKVITYVITSLSHYRLKRCLTGMK